MGDDHDDASLVELDFAAGASNAKAVQMLCDLMKLTMASFWHVTAYHTFQVARNAILGFQKC